MEPKVKLNTNAVKMSFLVRPIYNQVVRLPLIMTQDVVAGTKSNTRKIIQFSRTFISMRLEDQASPIAYLSGAMTSKNTMEHIALISFQHLMTRCLLESTLTTKMIKLSTI